MSVVVTSENFESEVLNSTLPVLVDFWAPWCGPCRMLSPIVDQLADEYAGRVKVCKLNVDDNLAITHTYGVASIPALLVFKGGKEVEKTFGAKPKASLIELLDKHL